METNSNILLPQISEENFPVYFSSQMNELSKLQEKIESSDKSAKKAMKFVSEQMTRYQVKGKWIFKYRSGNTKDIIEDTQDAIEKLAQAQHVSVEALKQSFNFQKKLAETSKKLFEMGCCNITMNRIAVRIITEKLSGAGKEELSELARQELISVVRQLKAQQDILMRQEKTEKKVKEITHRLDEKEKTDKKQTEHLQKIDVVLEEKDRIDKRQEKKISENKSEIDKININLNEKNKVDEQQTKHLKEIAIKLKEKDNVDKKQEEMIHSNKSEIDKLNIGLAEKDKIDTEQTEHLQKIDVVLEEKNRIDKRQEEQISNNESEINKIKQLYNQQSIQINKLEKYIISSNKNIKENYDDIYKNQLKEIKTLIKKINKIIMVVIILFIALISISLLMLYYKL